MTEVFDSAKRPTAPPTDPSAGGSTSAMGRHARGGRAARNKFTVIVNGFEVVAHVVEDATCGGRTVWLARFAREGT